jgi:hypothetical protein
VGAITVFAAAAYFLAVTNVVLPAFNDAGTPFYGDHYAPLGDSSAEIALNALWFERDVALSRLAANDAGGYFVDLGQPYGFIPYLAPGWLLLALPQLAANLLNIHGLAANPFAHYVATPLVACTLALIAALGSLRSRTLRAIGAGWVLVFAVTTATTRGFTPWSDNYRTGVWQLYDNQRSQDLASAVALVPDDAPVVATYTLTPHLTRRRMVYMYPNPWIADYWGIDGSDTDDPGPIEYVLIDRTTVSDDSLALVDGLLAAGFSTIHEQGPVLVLHRDPVEPGPNGLSRERRVPR